MPIFYSVIIRDSTVLAENAASVGNFSEIIKHIIQITPKEIEKSTLRDGSYLIHFIKQDSIQYMCITDNGFLQARAYVFLAEIKRRFLERFDNRYLAIPGPSDLTMDFSPVLAFEMKHYSDENISRVEGQVDEVKAVMEEAIRKALQRGEQLELLEERTQDLKEITVLLKRNSRSLAKKMYWKHIRMYLIIGVVLIVIIYVIVSICCGGLLLQSCIHRH